MAEPYVVGIVGTGLIGGSIGMRARRNGAYVVGYDDDPTAAAGALAVGALDQVVTRDELYARADTVVIAAHLAGTIAEIARLRDGSGVRAGLVLDVASVKVPVCEAADGLTNFVATHPLAGSERRGAAFSTPALFDGRTWAYVPTDDPRLTGRTCRWLATFGRFTAGDGAPRARSDRRLRVAPSANSCVDLRAPSIRARRRTQPPPGRRGGARTAAAGGSRVGDVAGRAARKCAQRRARAARTRCGVTGGCRLAWGRRTRADRRYSSPGSRINSCDGASNRKSLGGYFALNGLNARGFWVKSNASNISVARTSVVPIDAMPKFSSIVLRMLPNSYEYVNVSRFRVRRDDQARNANPQAAIVELRRTDVVVPPAPVVPQDDDGRRLPLRTPADRVNDRRHPGRSAIGARTRVVRPSGSESPRRRRASSPWARPRDLKRLLGDVPVPVGP